MLQATTGDISDSTKKAEKGTRLYMRICASELDEGTLRCVHLPSSFQTPNMFSNYLRGVVAPDQVHRQVKAGSFTSTDDKLKGFPSGAETQQEFSLTNLFPNKHRMHGQIVSPLDHGG